MRKATLVKLAGFVTALCATGALVAVTVPATGAYFQDSKGGSMTASSGHLTLTTGETTINFAGLMPGVNKSQDITYNVDATDGNVDVWLVFDKTTVSALAPSVTEYQLFTGNGSNPSGLGAYGFFQVRESHSADPLFTSGNLKFADATYTNYSTAGGECYVEAGTGRGGSGDIVTATNRGPLPYCGVPGKILLASNLASADSGTISLTFGLNGFKQTIQNQPEGTVHFSIVATQHGVPVA